MSTGRLHLAIIPDGNRRWAKAKSLLPWKGHEKSADNFSEIVEWAAATGKIEVLTIWCLSTENWKREPREIEELLKLLKKYLIKERASLIKNKIHLIRSGRSDRVPEELLSLIAEIGKETEEDPAMTLHLALDYGGKDEVMRAFNKYLATNNQQLVTSNSLREKELTEDSLASLLDHPELPPMDLIVRTSGEQRTSNFFLWQSAYSEWLFLEKHFPDITTADLDKAIADFGVRNRRFGA